MTAPAALSGEFEENLTPHGAPEWWLAEHGITNAFDAAELDDPDGDRMPTWKEWFASTDPTNAASVLAMNVPAPRGMVGAVVLWSSVSNKTYALERGTNLLTADFVGIESNIPATPPTNVYTDSMALPPRGVFYRVTVETGP
jgi:hypothetical protein